MGLSFGQVGALAAGAVTLTLANSITIEPAIAQSGIAVPGTRGESSPSQPRSSQATLLFVNPSQGQDQPNGGTEANPLQTITYALSRARTNTVIMLSPGTYSRASGEQFPLRLRSGVTLYGNPQQQGQGVIIHGGDGIETAYGSQQAALVGVDGSGVNGVTVSYPQGHGIWLDSGRLWIVNSTFRDNGNQGVAIAPQAEALSQNNRFVNNQGGNIGRLRAPQPSGRQANRPTREPETEGHDAVEVLSWGNASAFAMRQRSPSPDGSKPQVPQLAHRPSPSYQPPTPSRPIPSAGDLPSLPVPDGNPPVGDRGHLPLPATSALSNAAGAPPPPPTYASANIPPTRLQFRITVIPRNNSDLQLVQVLMPDALTLRRRDGSITQSAAFRHRNQAEAVLAELQRNGLSASLQSLDVNN
ncbi:DUF1565 domain-containing protein [Sodalinema gerasimenkoae]|uniref:DUF1565 domain-containing protein n=1 Tax=Sodalinema gerasimenkoae TaxID=2862348 RepID=UPI00135B1B46|nr:DUF1565 domain-containing protein [Sodalinema gerasimenkoae]